MPNMTRRLSVAGCALAALAWVGCSPAPEGWTPVLEETSTTFLRSETEAVAARVHAAMTDVQSDPAAAAANLSAAEDGLEHLLTYYLPLLEAREHAYNAYRLHYLGDTEATTRALDQVETILIAVAEAGHGHLLREMEDPLAQLTSARAALEADRGEATKALQSLARRLNLLLVKGGLVLTD